mgnify:CR=1 FL=1
MKGNEQVVAALNDTLRNAHSAFMQFAKHALWFKEKGYGKLAEMEDGEAAKEKAYLDQLAYRIMFLEGDPDFGSMGKAFFAADFRPNPRFFQVLCDQPEVAVHSDSSPVFTTRRIAI